ncbi:MAG: DUF2500 domain-containing protein [Eubacteriales bacterium]|jgi:hypothetical protein|nr:DUF2500 domain-containing protein [Eubacteriales bacterium]
MFEEPWYFNLFQIIFPVIFLAVLGVFIFTGIKGLKEWMHNNRQQVFNDPVMVIDKRTHIWGGHHSGTHHTGAHTSYYITFEFENGDRQEFMVSGRVYGQTAPGDTGTLTWQGTRFHDFQRVQL